MQSDFRPLLLAGKLRTVPADAACHQHSDEHPHGQDQGADHEHGTHRQPIGPGSFPQGLGSGSLLVGEDGVVAVEHLVLGRDGLDHEQLPGLLGAPRLDGLQYVVLGELGVMDPCQGGGEGLSFLRGEGHEKIAVPRQDELPGGAGKMLLQLVPLERVGGEQHAVEHHHALQGDVAHGEDQLGLDVILLDYGVEAPVEGIHIGEPDALQQGGQHQDQGESQHQGSIAALSL